MLGAHPLWRRLAIGLLAVACGLAVRLAAEPVMGPTLPFVTLYPAVMLAAIFGGASAGVTAVVASIAYAIWFLTARELPMGLPDAAGRAMGIALFVLGCGLLVGVAHFVRKTAATARATQGRLEAALNASRVGTWRWDVARDILEWDEPLALMYGLTLDQAPRTSAQFFALVHEQDRSRVHGLVAGMLKHGGAIEFEFRVQRPDGALQWIFDRSRAERDSAGRPQCVVGACLDITERKRAEEENAHLAAVVAASRDAIVSFDISGAVRSWNHGAEVLFGESREAVANRRAAELPCLPSGTAAAVERGLRGETSNFDGRGVGADGEPLHATVITTPMLDARGERRGVSCIVRDDGARHAAMEAQKLLVRELHHRVRNTLGTVQALISSTARTAESAAHLRDSLGARVRALARTHDLVTLGVHQRASVRDLLWLELEAFADPPERIALDGPRFDLDSAQAFNLAMAAHELTTNAAKYGALSAPAGEVSVTWRLEREGGGASLAFDWRERGGPPVGDTPRKGFGMSLLRRLFPRPGELEIEMAPQGLRCRFQMALPAGDAASPDAEQGPASAASVESSHWEDQTIK